MWHHALIYNIIHLLFTFYAFLLQICHILLDWFHLSPPVTPTTLQDDLACLEKIPSRLALVIQTSSHRPSHDPKDLLEDIAQFACYCSAAGIHSLSLYDVDGTLKHLTPTLYKQISRTQRLWLFPSSRKSSSKEWALPPPLQLSVLSYIDGRPQIAQAARGLHGNVLAGHLNSDDIDVPVVEAALLGNEPELMIVWGGEPKAGVVLDGFPPWHMRLTEIFNGSRYERIDYTLFKSSLYRYSKVEQRFGR